MSGQGYGYNSRRVSPVRATEAAIGLGLLGYGGSRTKILTSTLKVGQRVGNHRSAYARAEKARQAVEQRTGRGAAMISRNLGTGIRLRPIEATVGGGFVLNDALPIRRQQFTPVQRGWR